MQMSVPTERKKTVASVCEIASLLFSVRSATWTPRTTVNDNRMMAPRVTQMAASRFLVKSIS
jgi:hypothetical protein